MCLNIDGSVELTNHSAGLGCVIRNHKGEMVKAGATSIGGTTINGVELYAFRTGMLLAEMCNISKLVIQTDLTYICSCFHGEKVAQWQEQHLVQDILDVAQQFEDLQVTFVCREQNSVSDALAKFASSPAFCEG